MERLGQEDVVGFLVAIKPNGNWATRSTTGAPTSSHGVYVVLSFSTR